MVCNVCRFDEEGGGGAVGEAAGNEGKIKLVMPINKSDACVSTRNNNDEKPAKVARFRRAASRGIGQNPSKDEGARLRRPFHAEEGKGGRSKIGGHWKCVLTNLFGNFVEI